MLPFSTTDEARLATKQLALIVMSDFMCCTVHYSRTDFSTASAVPPSAGLSLLTASKNPRGALRFAALFRLGVSGMCLRLSIGLCCITCAVTWRILRKLLTARVAMQFPLWCALLPSSDHVDDRHNRTQKAGRQP